MRLTDDELLDEVRGLYESLGRPPKYRELRHASTIANRFGSLKNALEACGINEFARPKTTSYKRMDRMLNGYRVVYRPDHFNCNLGSSYDGYVYEHRYVMEQHLGRKLSRNEIVHHKDRNRSNNDISNLELMSISEHGKRHAIESGLSLQQTKYCVDCGKKIDPKATRCVRCSWINARVIERPSYEQLVSEIKATSYLAVGKKYGVSDNAIRKWLKQYEREALTCAH